MDLKAPGHAERRLQVVLADDPLLHDLYWAVKLRQPVLSVQRDGPVVRGKLTVILD